MGRSPCCAKEGLRRGPWSTKEDTLLTNYIQEHGEGQWRSLPKKAGLLRCGKSCRLRWMNYLRPGIKRGNITQDEEDLIIRLHKLLGNRWSLIAGRLPGRTDNEIKNYWNTHLLKKLKSSGIEPQAHKDLPKPAKEPKKKNPETAKQRKKKQKKNESENGSKTEQAEEPKTKSVICMPKPIRISSLFPRTSSVDSLLSGSSSSEGDAEKEVGRTEVSYMPWPLSDLDEAANYGRFQACDEGEDLDFLNCCVFPIPHSDSSNDLGMLEKVYDEYLQLL